MVMCMYVKKHSCISTSQKISSKLLAMMIWGFGAENRRGVSEDFHIWIHIFIEYIYNMQTLCFYPMKILFLITINWELSFSSNKTKSNLIVTFWKWGPYHIKALETCLVQHLPGLVKYLVRKSFIVKLVCLGLSFLSVGQGLVRCVKLSMLHVICQALSGTKSSGMCKAGLLGFHGDTAS